MEWVHPETSFVSTGYMPGELLDFWNFLFIVLCPKKIQNETLLKVGRKEELKRRTLKTLLLAHSQSSYSLWMTGYVSSQDHPYLT